MGTWFGNSGRYAAVAFALAVLGSEPHLRHLPSAPSPSRAAVAAAYANRTLAFEANAGQADADIRFVARAATHTLLLTADEAVIQLTGDPTNVSTVRMRLETSRPGRLASEEELPGKVHYFRGNDPSGWRTNVATYAKVRRADVYDGIDVVYYGAGRALEYDFVVAPGARVSDIRMRFDGAEIPEINDGGELVLRTPNGELRQRPPIVYQHVDGVRTSVEGRYVARDDGLIGFEVGAYDASSTLVIDPVLIYSTYLGGPSTDFAQGIAVDSEV